MTTTAGHPDRAVARAAVARAVLLGRAAATLTVVGGGLRLSAQPAPLVAVLALVLLTTAVALIVLSRHPHVVAHRLPVLVADAATVLAVLGLAGGDVAFFSCAVGASALAGVLAGFWALVPAACYAGLGYLVAGQVLGAVPDAASLAGFVLAFPIVNVLVAAGAAVATAALAAHVALSVNLVASAQRTAAAAERARLARELHDSVSKTLRGVSFAALALPTSLRRQPALAEQLAATVSAGASAAVRQAQDVLDGLRLDDPDREFGVTVDRICRRWAAREGIPVRSAVAGGDLPLELRYELAQILHESLENIARHAGAGLVTVELAYTRGGVRLRVADDGTGFRVPAEWSGCHGLTGMAERAAAVRGTLRVESGPGAGTTVVVDVALTAAAGAPS
ncbi:sensor histidine kinase [Catellatospora methionotrophica]|uniref:sensor histidine kinase n=1 Tax=Catellatospora methionotrophica TaxID=121620 RepID=UPI00140A4FE1|nr:histidine kinase [Catellatospora methionotrophica]